LAGLGLAAIGLILIGCGEQSEPSNTLSDKRSMLRPDGPIMNAFAGIPVAAIGPRDLEDWWPARS